MIDTNERLAQFVPRLKAAEWVAVDTEADSLHAYPEKVCLIQISTTEGDILVDPLASVDLGALLEALSGRELIMHGADYDLRLLRKHHEFVPSSVFDTMLAGRLLGLRQFGLSHLVETYLGVKLEKGPQKANWAMRPLTPRMEHYARNDTRHLRPLEEKLKKELAARERLSWHQETCVRLIAESSVEQRQDPESVWRVSGSHALERPGLAILRELWRWRESEAVRANRPPYFVMSHEKLVEIASAAAISNPIEPHLPKNLSERRRAGLKKAVEHGLSISPDQHPHILRGQSRRSSEAERRRFIDLRKRRDARAEQLGLDPTLIASRADLSDLAHDWDKNVGNLMNWQRDLLANRV